MKIELFRNGGYLVDGRKLVLEEKQIRDLEIKERALVEKAFQNTISYRILQKHNISNDDKRLKIRFDAIASHDITYVSIIQTARASGMTEFSIPFVLSNCHNSLCAIGGTINEDDHAFGYSAAVKYRGIFVPANMAVIHQFMRENFAGCGRMILSTDSHTRYGALGTIAMGEGGGELVKQLLGETYDIDYPEIVCMYVTGKVTPGVGPQDIALAIIKECYHSEFVKNKIIEFVGPGIAGLPIETRIGVDVMMTEAGCLSTIWETDEDVKAFLQQHQRPDDYERLYPGKICRYDKIAVLRLDEIRPMIALPFHPSNAYEIRILNDNLEDILRTTEKDIMRITGSTEFRLTDKIIRGQLKVDQGIICGCAGGTYRNIMEAAHIIKKNQQGIGNFNLSVYPSSLPVYEELVKKGAAATLMSAGIPLKTCFCGPCFGIGDTPANKGLSIRHVTRNFAASEGSLPEKGQIAAVALMDARSIAATAINGGFLTSALDIADHYEVPEYRYDAGPYHNRVYNGFTKAEREKPLTFGPNISDWPEFPPLKEHAILKICAKFEDPIVTTDDLLPSGEASSYRSNPGKLAEFALSRRFPEYVSKSKAVRSMDKHIAEGSALKDKHVAQLIEKIHDIKGYENFEIVQARIGSCLCGNILGDGSAREQAVSSQKVLGGLANIAREYATRRYHSNLLNWGVLPFTTSGVKELEDGDWIFVPEIYRCIAEGRREIEAVILRDVPVRIKLMLSEMGERNKKIMLSGCLINYYRHCRHRD